MCRGHCCTFVNDVINILVECGELDPDAEVNIILMCCVVYMCCYRVSVEQWEYILTQRPDD